MNRGTGPAGNWAQRAEARRSRLISQGRNAQLSVTRTESLKVPGTKESTLTHITLQIAFGRAKGAPPTMTNVALAATRTRSAATMATSIGALEVSANTTYQMPKAPPTGSVNETPPGKGRETKH